ncbi:HxlR family transcriptional regulator [Asanoa ferruginea]|uniref:HxlR family transcriptional regulator n=1 Tax=Asanoa ferruginea TaxID=53367 RepID=A0A3D9ZWV2_9ACTN|nr:helix-turn-helix domain-containing protein [Asanoa ferruginea]REG01669.1 HxlR family transcriptional regulator [Asanoa ferruginea]GIF51679.1 transcriptional regulator [Asanoa ferruginea]
MTIALDPDLFAGCGTDRPLIRIGDKWTMKIIVCLRDGPRRFGELAIPLRGITAKVLTESLRSMERDGLITRTAYPEIPPRVEYALTPLGRTLLEPLAAICAWSAAHLPEVLRQRDERVA